MSGPAPLLSLRRITKRFPNVVANDRVDFDAYPGEVHALLGENGAGKSTLMKLAYGYERPDSGEILIDSQPVAVRSPRDARRLGVGMVFQGFALIPGFTVAENIALHLPALPALPDRAAIEREIRSRGEELGFAVDPARIAGTLSAGEQQMVEILKLLLGGARVLIFDEPTSVLPPHQVHRLFEIFERLKASGYAVIFITHKLHEVLESADRITVMRRGAVAATLARSDATEQRLLELMFGAAAAAETEPALTLAPAEPGPAAVRLEGVTTGGPARPVQGVDLELRAGEIVGVAGVSGNGQQALADAILGLLPLARGRRLLFGEDATRWSVRRIRDAGVAFVPENPSYMAVAAGLSLAENFALASPGTYQRRAGLAMDWGRVRADFDAAYRTLELEPPDPAATAGSLSGGNLQRFSLARELGRSPRVIVALYPTRGLDALTTRRAEEVLVRARAGGAAVLLISQELGELFELSDRIVVLRGGRLAGEVRPAGSSQLEVGRLMTGGE